jgi:predicted branched-subunit amino acid permease
MNHIEPFDYVLAFGVIGSTIGLIPDMNEIFRFLILVSTFIGIVIKTWEQVKKSEFFLNDIKDLWKKIRGK